MENFGNYQLNMLMVNKVVVNVKVKKLAKQNFQIKKNLLKKQEKYMVINITTIKLFIMVIKLM